MNYEKYFEKGEPEIAAFKEYNSDNTFRLDLDGMKCMLEKLPLTQKKLKQQSLNLANK